MENCFVVRCIVVVDSLFEAEVSSRCWLMVAKTLRYRTVNMLTVFEYLEHPLESQNVRHMALSFAFSTILDAFFFLFRSLFRSLSSRRKQEGEPERQICNPKAHQRKGARRRRRRKRRSGKTRKCINK